MGLPPYDPGARCPKCGNDGVTTEYSDGKVYGTRYNLIADRGEYLLRVCARCGYAWREACHIAHDDDPTPPASGSAP